VAISSGLGVKRASTPRRGSSTTPVNQLGLD
jgi:hypothetical protein